MPRSREEFAAYQRARRAEKKRLGICLGCPAPALPARRHCRDCADRIRAYSRARMRIIRADRTAAGRCVNCGRDNLDKPGVVHCPACRASAKVRVYLSRRRALGLPSLAAIRSARRDAAQAAYLADLETWREARRTHTVRFTRVV